MSSQAGRGSGPETPVARSDTDEGFRLLIDSLRDYSIFPLSIEGRVANWNVGAERLKGYTTEEALGLPIAVFFPTGEQAERVPDRLLHRAEVDGRAEYEGWLARKDGSQFWGSVVVSAMRDEQGRLRGFSNIARNLTERKKIEKSQAFLAEAGELLTGSLDYETTLQQIAQLAVRSLADWCTVTVRSSEGMLTVRAAAHADSTQEQKVLGLLRVLPDDPQCPHGISQVVRTGISDICPDTLEGAWVRSALGVDTPERLMSLGAYSYLCVPLKARGSTFGALTFVSVAHGRSYGPTDLALAEELARRAGLAMDNARLFREAQDALESRDEFLSMASHDLRSPLTALRLQLQSVRRDLQSGTGAAGTSERLVGRMESMERQTDRMVHMLDALLDITQMSAGRLELKLQPVDLVDVARAAVATIEEEIRQSGVDVQVVAEGPVEGMWDRLRIEQVVDNLLSNAMKYGAGRPIELVIGGNAETATLVVRDRGVGIAPEDMARLFDRFERVRIRPETSGYGVGLWIVRRVVDAHGGRVSVESREGGGSCFTVHLPVRPLAAARHEPSAPVDEPRAINRLH